MSLKLTWDQEVILVNEVKKYGALFDNNHEDFRNLKKREKIWERICQKIGLPVADCKARWGNLRRIYVKRRRTGGGKWEYEKTPGCNYMELLSFLPNYNESEAYPEEASPVKNKKKDKKKRNNEQHNYDETEYYDNTDGAENEDQYYEDYSQEDEQEYYNDGYTEHADEGAREEHYTDSPKKKKQKKNHNVHKNTGNEFNVPNKKRKTEHTLPHNQSSLQTNVSGLDKKWSDTSVKGNMSDLNESIVNYKSPTNKFFEAMGDLVDKYPADLQAQIRLKVCQTVTEMEMKYLEHNK